MIKKPLIILSIFYSLVFINASVAEPRKYLSDKCKNHLIDFYQVEKPLIENFKVLEDQNYYLQTLLKRVGTEDVKIKAIAYEDKDKQRIFGYKYEWKNQSIVDCWSFYHAAMITLVEKYDHYDPFLTTQNEAIKISTHYFVNCGVPCHHAEVTAAYMIDDGTTPYVKKEITSPTFEYPSIWFRDYLTLKELFEFMNTENGFESFDWRGRRYKTSELAKKFR